MSEQRRSLGDFLREEPDAPVVTSEHEEEDAWGEDPSPVPFKNTDPAKLPTLASIGGDHSKSALEGLRDAALHGPNSLYIMAKVVLGYSKLNDTVHLPMCRFAVQTRRVGSRRLMLMPRGHYKTTIWTIADSIQLVCLDPNIQLLIIADTDTNAARFMREIQMHFERNELFRTMFSDIVPENFNRAIWNRNEMEVRRTSISRDPTIDAVGALSANESRHYHYIKADDLVTEKCIHSDVEMDKVNSVAGGLESLLVSVNDDSIDYVGSRKKSGDLYELQEKHYGEGHQERKIGPHAYQKGPLVVFWREAEENGEVILPSVISKKFLQRLRKYDPQRYHAQYGNSPKGEGVNTFDFKSLRYYKWTDDGRIVLQHDGKTLDIISPWMLQRIALYDPSVAEKKRSSKQALHVVAKGNGPNRIILESIVGHIPPDVMVRTLFEVDKKWRPEFFSIEKRGFQGWVKYHLEEYAESRALPYIQVMEWPPEGDPSGQWAKIEHIRGLQPIIRAEALWVHESMKELIDCIELYPNVRWDDALDALSQGLTYWPASIDEFGQKARQEKERHLLDQIVMQDGMRYLPSGLVSSGPSESRETEWDEQAYLAQFGASGYDLVRPMEPKRLKAAS